MIPTNTPIFNAGAPKTEVKYPFTRISFPNSVWVTAFGSASMSEEMPNSAPVITLIRIKAITDAKAPPARSFAQEPPIATAKRICRLLMMAQPMLSIVLPTVKIMLISAPAICTSFPRLIIRPAAGITAITAISTFPSFCKKSKLMDSFFFSDFGSGAEFSRLSDGSVCVFCSSFRFSLVVSVKSTLFPASTCPG